MPTEAQWEYAARGGKFGEALKYEYAGSNHLKEVGWYRRNSHSETKSVKLKLPNELGFYDISGNVSEWCQDKSTNNLEQLPENGLPYQLVDDDKEDIRVIRGGFWSSNDFYCRVSYRMRNYSDYRNDFIGFRLSRY